MTKRYQRVVCPSLIYRFWFPLWYLLVIVLSVLLWLTDSGYPFGIFWSLCCLSFFYLQILQTTQWPKDTKGVIRICKGQTTQWPKDTKGVTRICKEGQTTQCPKDTKGVTIICKSKKDKTSVLLWLTDSGYPFGIFWQLCCLSFFDWQILVTPLVSLTDNTMTKRYQGVTRICKSKKDRQHNDQKIPNG
jgi:hypothetical protein